MATVVDEADRVSLYVGGQVHSEWSTYDVDSDLLTPADAWNFTLGLTPGSKIPEAIVPGAPVQVRVGKDPVMTGRIDEIAHVVTRPTPSLSISGRDSAAILVDCSAPIFAAREVGLDEVAAKIVRPLGITKVRIDADSTSRAAKINIEPGMSAWDALQQSAEANGLWPWFEPDGTLVIGGPDYSVEPVAELIMRLDGQGNNVLKLGYSRSMAGRYSEVTVLGQSHGAGAKAGQHNIKAAAKDEAVLYYRPKIEVDGDVENVTAARSRARKYVADSRLQGATLSAIVKGHRTSAGTLWTPGQRIRVLSEPHDLDAIFFLMARKFTGGRGQQTLTALTLKEDGVWVLDAKRKKRKKKKGEKKLTPTIIDVS